MSRELLELKAALHKLDETDLSLRKKHQNAQNVLGQIEKYLEDGSPDNETKALINTALEKIKGVAKHYAQNWHDHDHDHDHDHEISPGQRGLAGAWFVAAIAGPIASSYAPDEVTRRILMFSPVESFALLALYIAFQNWHNASAEEKETLNRVRKIEENFNQKPGEAQSTNGWSLLTDFVS